MDLNSVPYYKIVLTGGPCGGKTTLQVLLSDVFENMGWKVYCVAETATLLLSGGVVFSTLDDEQVFQFQYNLLKVMMALEDTFTDLARSDAKKGQKAIVICDRGCMDPSAYIGREKWEEILKKTGYNEVWLRDERYDCVIHMVTAAKGAEAYFGKETNSVRSEDCQHARLLDEAVAKAWVGHPSYDIIDNSTGFEKKKNRAVASILNRLGLNTSSPEKDVIKRRFLIKNFTLNNEFPVEYSDFEVHHFFLNSTNGNQTILRKRGNKGNHAYSVILKFFDEKGESMELRRTIQSREYDTLSLQRDKESRDVIKLRRCFLWDHHYFQLDFYETPHSDLVLLESYIHNCMSSISSSPEGGESPCSSPLVNAGNDENLNVSNTLLSGTQHLSSTGGSVKKENPLPFDLKKILPSFLNIEKEVTWDLNYSLYNLSRVSSL